VSERRRRKSREIEEEEFKLDTKKGKSHIRVEGRKIKEKLLYFALLLFGICH
jgi:hypothetical protein